MDSGPAPKGAHPGMTKKNGDASRNDERSMMRTTILFGGTSKERLVSVASAQSLQAALPDAELWFWDAGNTVHQVTAQVLVAHARPFEDPFQPQAPSLGAIEQALDRAK